MIATTEHCPSWLVLDELAYVPLQPSEAKLVFQVLDARAELASTVITTNLPFLEWTSVFPGPRLCKAIVDRLTFNAHIIADRRGVVAIPQDDADLN